MRSPRIAIFLQDVFVLSAFSDNLSPCAGLLNPLAWRQRTTRNRNLGLSQPRQIHPKSIFQRQIWGGNLQRYPPHGGCQSNEPMRLVCVSQAHWEAILPTNADKIVQANHHVWRTRSSQTRRRPSKTCHCLYAGICADLQTWWATNDQGTLGNQSSEAWRETRWDVSSEFWQGLHGRT